MRAYRDPNDRLLHRHLRHRSPEELVGVAARLGWATWEDCNIIVPTACPWLLAGQHGREEQLMADERVTVTDSKGRSVTVNQGSRYYKPGGKANIRAESETLIYYENSRNEQAPKTRDFFVSHYRDKGYRSPFPHGS
jgi:hypothetical protein